MCLAIGIDIGGTRIKAALVDRNGAYFETHIEPTKLTDDYELLLMQLLDIYTVLSSRSPEPVVGIGIGVAGLMNKGNSRIETSPNIKVWIGRALAYDLEQTINVSCKMENDANCMAIGEGLSGAAIDCKHYIAITLGTGIGGAVICNGNLLRGVSGGGGEIGHITIDPNGPVCGCGNSGCIESYIGTSGIRRYVEENHPGLNERSIKNLISLQMKGLLRRRRFSFGLGGPWELVFQDWLIFLILKKS